jgi:hypothetical protein
MKTASFSRLEISVSQPFASSPEPLESRIAPAFVGSVSANGLEATFTGDGADDELFISASGEFLTHNRFGIDAGFASFFDFDSSAPGEQTLPTITGTFIADLGGGDDMFAVTGNAAVMRIFGGAGNDNIRGSNFADVLSGGPGNDFIDGQQQNDTILGGDGDDVFQWDPGDGSDIIDGNAGDDKLLFNGSNASEIYEFFANGGRLTLTRNVANIVMDVGTVEFVTLRLLGGTDVTNIADLSSTSVRAIDLKLGAITETPDLQSDVVTVRGSALADDIRVRNSGDIIEVVGLATLVRLDGIDPLGTATPDALSVFGEGGVDNVVATNAVRAKLIVGTDGETENPAPPILQFSAPVSLDVGRNPSGIASGNLFGLGNDLVIANTKSNTVSVLFNIGNGTFLPALLVGSGGKAPKSVVLEDFNGDGSLDIAVTNSGSGNVAVLINNGDGTFAAPALFTTGKKPGVLRTADVTGDGITDLVTITAGNRLSILPGDGSGGFGDATTVATGGRNPVDFLFKDFNADGRLDIAVANTGSNNVTILVANADSTFAAPLSIRVGTKPTALAVGDFDGDGRADLVVANAVSRFVSVLLNASTGGITAFNDQLKLTHLGKNAPGAIAVDDLDNDGRDDIIVGNTAAGSISAFLNSGGATFRSPLKFDLDNTPPRKSSAFVLVDLNGDGRLDIATTNAGTNDISLLVGLPA